MSNDVLFELGCEELPSGLVSPLACALMNHVAAGLLKANIAHGAMRCFATPRRLAVLIESVALMQQDQPISRRGPQVSNARDANGQPTPALLGFAKSCGVSVDALSTLTTDKGSWWVYETIQQGTKTADVLPSLIREAIAQLPISKAMRWGNGTIEFVRPVHWAVLLFGADVIETEILGLTTGRNSRGHRFHHPEPVVIPTPGHYESLLRDAFVVADFEVRRNVIVQQVQVLASQSAFNAVMPQALVDEVTSIVEWPHVLMASFDKEFLDVPQEALIAAMQSHQKCFALRNSAGNLVPYFITVANIDSRDPAKVIAGNEKVMRARLSDAAFFFRLDKKHALHGHVDATKQVVFQAKLGSLFDKAMRVDALMAYLVSPLRLNATHAARSAMLSKCDLMTGMVGEFPELQGLMGYYYALHDKEDMAVALALNEQYMPRFAKDALPSSDLGRALSLADRIDTLVGTFAIGQKPTGVKDPFKLRRHALAVVRLLIAMPAALPLSALIEQGLKGYGESIYEQRLRVDELRPFILDRLLSYYQTEGVSLDRVHAVCARADDSLYDIDKRINALQDFSLLPAATALSAACKRVNNLLQHVSFVQSDKTVDKNLLIDLAEHNLFSQIQTIEARVAMYYRDADYRLILHELATLQQPVDVFFEQVLVMVEDHAIKENRLCLLARLQKLLQGVADISLLQLHGG